MFIAPHTIAFNNDIMNDFSNLLNTNNLSPEPRKRFVDDANLKTAEDFPSSPELKKKKGSDEQATPYRSVIGSNDFYSGAKLIPTLNKSKEDINEESVEAACEVMK